MEYQGTRRHSCIEVCRKSSLTSSEALSLRRNSGAALLDDIISGCSHMKVQRTVAVAGDADDESAAAVKAGKTGGDDDGGGERLAAAAEEEATGRPSSESQYHHDLQSDSDGREDGQYTMFHLLPWQDVLHPHIFRCLHLIDVFRLRATCRAGRDCIDEYFRVCPVVNAARYGPRLTPVAFRLVTAENVSLRTLVLRQARGWLTDELLLPAMTASRHLQHVDLTGCSALSSRSVVALAGSAPRLRELYLRECPWLSREAVVLVAQNCRLLEKLDLTGCWAVDDEAITMVSLCCRSLVFISVAKIYGITDYAIRCLATNCTKLHHINMHSCWRVTDSSVRMLGEYCHRLRLLQVRECRDVTEASLARLREQGIKLDVPQPPCRRNILQTLKLQV